MNDTSQTVRWTLGHACALRSDEAVHDPAAALRAIEQARGVARRLRKPGAFRIVGDWCVTSVSYAQGPEDREGVLYPSNGYNVEKAFAGAGGLQGLIGMCRACPACTHEDAAGCAGSLNQHPESPKIESQLQGILTRLALHDEVRRWFLPTSPVWPGLWARSPVPEPAIAVLGKIVAAMREEDAVAGSPGEELDHRLAELDAFVAATRVALERRLPLYVDMAPPIQDDFAAQTVLAHCPACKVGARAWNRENEQVLRCHVCATEYRPVETRSMTRTMVSWGTLRAELGAGFPAFAARYLVECGSSEADAHEIVRLKEERDLRVETQAFAEATRTQRTEEYVREVLFADLHPTYPRDPNVIEVYDEYDQPSFSSAQFGLRDFVELMARCERAGVIVTSMMHESVDRKMNRLLFADRRRPTLQLAEWLAEGCSERFRASFRVPEELLAKPN